MINLKDLFNIFNPEADIPVKVLDTSKIKLSDQDRNNTELLNSMIQNQFKDQSGRIWQGALLNMQTSPISVESSYSIYCLGFQENNIDRLSPLSTVVVIGTPIFMTRANYVIRNTGHYTFPLSDESTPRAKSDFCTMLIAYLSTLHSNEIVDRIQNWINNTDPSRLYYKNRPTAENITTPNKKDYIDCRTYKRDFRYTIDNYLEKPIEDDKSYYYNWNKKERPSKKVQLEIDIMFKYHHLHSQPIIVNSYTTYEPKDPFTPNMGGVTKYHFFVAN